MDFSLCEEGDRRNSVNDIFFCLSAAAGYSERSISMFPSPVNMRDFGVKEYYERIADIVCPKGSRIPHLYGLYKTHRQKLSIRPILLASGTNNFALAKWLDDTLRPLSLDKYTISDIFFSEDQKDNDAIVSYIVTCLSYLLTCHAKRQLTLQLAGKHAPTIGSMNNINGTSL